MMREWVMIDKIQDEKVNACFEYFDMIGAYYWQDQMEDAGFQVSFLVGKYSVTEKPVLLGTAVRRQENLAPYIKKKIMSNKITIDNGEDLATAYEWQNERKLEGCDISFRVERRFDGMTKTYHLVGTAYYPC